MDGAGNVTISAEDDILQNAAGDVTTDGGGGIDFNAGTDSDDGVITMANGAESNTDSGLITFDADGDITLGGVKTSGEVRITSSIGAIVDGGDTFADITASMTALRAGTGIGDSGQLDTVADPTAMNLTIAAETDSGDINVSNTGELIVGTVDSLVGVSVTDTLPIGPTNGVENSGLDEIRLVASTNVRLNAPIVNEDESAIQVIAIADTVQGGVWLATDLSAAAANVTLSGTVAPGGGAPGVLDVTGDFNFPNDSTFDVNLNGTSPGETASDHDQIKVAGEVNIGSNVSLAVDGTFVAAPGSSQTFVIIDNNGTSDAVNGTFDGLAENTIFTATIGGESKSVQISYQGGDGNDVVLTVLSAPIYNFADANFAVDELNAAHTTHTVIVKRSGDTARSSTVDVVLTNGTATSSDYVAGPISLSFDVGELAKTVPIEILGDTLVEANETLGLSLTNFSNAGFAGTVQPTSTLTITDDDSATISIDNVTGGEGNNFEFTVTLSNVVDEAITMQVDTVEGSATASDFVGLSAATLKIGGGGLIQKIIVPTNTDFESESAESFSVLLSNLVTNGRNVSFADAEGLGTILDIPVLAIDDVIVREGDTTNNILVPARISKPLSSDLLVQYVVMPGSATPIGDYETVSGEFTIPAGDTTFDFPISVVGDHSPEANETFTVHITFLQSIGNNVAVSDSQSLVTLENDDELAVMGVKVGSTDWTPEFKAFVDPSGDDFGYPIPTGASQLDPLPWANIDQIQLQFNADISSSFDENLFGLGGFHTPDYSSNIISTVYDSTNFTVTMTLDTFLGDDQLVVVASDILTRASGESLDGEWTTGQPDFPSGDGATGGDFAFRFDVLPGDVDSSGTISSNDGLTSLRLQSQTVGAAFYLAFADIDGNGIISSNDGFFSMRRQGSQRPKGTPTLPTLPLTVRIEPVAAAIAAIEEDDREIGTDDELDSIVEEFAGDLPQLPN